MSDSYNSNKPLNILKASLPYITPSMQKAISYYIKIEEFNMMVNSFTNSENELSTCDISSIEHPKNFQFNSKGLINAIRPYLNNNESEVINMFLNLLNAMKFYNIYSNMPEQKDTIIPTDDQSTDNTFSDESSINNISFDNKENTNKSTLDGNSKAGNIDIESLKNMLTPSQRAMFEAYSSMLNNKEAK